MYLWIWESDFRILEQFSGIFLNVLNLFSSRDFLGTFSLECEKVNWLLSCRDSGCRRYEKSAKSAKICENTKIGQKRSRQFPNSVTGLGRHCMARERFFFSERCPQFVPFTFLSSIFIRKRSSGLCRLFRGFADFRRFSQISQIFADFSRFSQISADLTPRLRALRLISLLLCLCVFLG